MNDNLIQNQQFCLLRYSLKLMSLSKKSNLDYYDMKYNILTAGKTKGLGLSYKFIKLRFKHFYFLTRKLCAIKS